jgi:hypothetical protein
MRLSAIWHVLTWHHYGSLAAYVLAKSWFYSFKYEFVAGFVLYERHRTHLREAGISWSPTRHCLLLSLRLASLLNQCLCIFRSALCLRVGEIK